MSYEGYVQCLCTNGCYWSVDVYVGKEEEETLCPTCRLKPVWENSVDTTNFHGVGHIEMEAFQIDKNTYRIPTDEETRNAQTYYDPRFSKTIRLVDRETPEHKARVAEWEANETRRHKKAKKEAPSWNRR